MGRHWKYRRDDGGSMLATIIVIVGGCGLCWFIAVSANAFQLQLGISIVSVIAVVQLIRLRYGKSRGARLSIFNAIQRNPCDENAAAQYRPVKIKDRRSESPAGGNKPITAEEAHQIQINSANTWVPGKATQRDADQN
ncbi:MAG: hypothetical protein NXI04_05570 [Planctomycetaceae bacterium]|nr:hypothetical protein [Planctomycetaceae bacterium]